MGNVHQLPVSRNTQESVEQDLARALRRAVDARVGTEASFEQRETARGATAPSVGSPEDSAGG